MYIKSITPTNFKKHESFDYTNSQVVSASIPSKNNNLNYFLGAATIASVAATGIEIKKNKKINKELKDVISKLKEAEKKAKELEENAKKKTEKTPVQKKKNNNTKVVYVEKDNKDIINNCKKIILDISNAYEEEISKLKDELNKKSLFERLKTFFKKKTTHSEKSIDINHDKPVDIKSTKPVEIKPEKPSVIEEKPAEIKLEKPSVIEEESADVKPPKSDEKKQNNVLIGIKKFANKLKLKNETAKFYFRTNKKLPVNNAAFLNKEGKNIKFEPKISDENIPNVTDILDNMKRKEERIKRIKEEKQRQVNESKESSDKFRREFINRENKDKNKLNDGYTTPAIIKEKPYVLDKKKFNKKNQSSKRP